MNLAAFAKELSVSCKIAVSGGFIKLEKTFGEKSSDNDKYLFLS